MSAPSISMTGTQHVSTTRSWTRDVEGTFTLVTFILRQERKRLLIWFLVIIGMLFAFESFISDLTATTEGVEDIKRFMQGATGALFGPGYGRFEPTAERYLAGVYSSFFHIPIALLTIGVVGRHTRAEERNGHAELIRSNVVGKYAQLTASLTVATLMNVAIALTLGTFFMSQGYDTSDGYLFGASIGAIGLVSAGITALTVQLTESPRSATAYAGFVLAVAWVIRLIGDMIQDYGSPLSWFSPLAWSQQTRPYVDGRWWPLLLSLGLAILAASYGYMLSGKRDIGAGIIANKPGAPTAAPWLKTSFSLALRLNRGSLMWWTIGLAALAFVLGTMGDEVADPEKMSADRVEMFGGSLETVFEGFLDVLALLIAILTSVMLTKGVSVMRQEESGGRVEPLLATAVSKSAWFTGYFMVLAAGALLMLVSSGLAMGSGAAIVMGDTSFILDSVVTHLAFAPAVLVSLGLAYFLLGNAPRHLGFSWIVVTFGVVSGFMARSLDLPTVVQKLSPFEHVGSPMIDGVSVVPTVILTAIGVTLLMLGYKGFQRRDLAIK